MEDVQVPVAGKVKREYLIVGGAVVAFFLYRQWKGNGAAAADAAPVADPATGSTATGSDYVNPDPTGPVAPPVNNVTGDVIPTTDAEWTSASVNALSATGFDPQSASVALAKYLSGQYVTLDEQVMIRTAWAFQGHPPQHPQLAMVTTPPGGTAAPTTPTPTPSPAPSGPLAAPGGFSGRITGGTADLWWHPVTGAKEYRVYSRGGGTSKSISAGWAFFASTNGTSVQHGGMIKGRWYEFSVRAVDSGGNLGTPVVAGLWLQAK